MKSRERVELWLYLFLDFGKKLGGEWIASHPGSFRAGKQPINDDNMYTG